LNIDYYLQLASFTLGLIGLSLVFVSIYQPNLSSKIERYLSSVARAGKVGGDGAYEAFMKFFLLSQCGLFGGYHMLDEVFARSDENGFWFSTLFAAGISVGLYMFLSASLRQLVVFFQNIGNAHVLSSAGLVVAVLGFILGAIQLIRILVL
tara:strand:+ start:2756 stop:3208 length:453 start_codon:yes stop_codon:yes gene_type:complete